MNKFKEKEEEPKSEIKEKNPFSQKRTKGVARSFIAIISGSFLTREKTVKLLPFFLFLFLMAMAYIANGYYAEEKIRRLNSITNELKELRSEYITIKSDLMFISKQSEVAKAAETMGIKESVVPPKKIVVKVSLLSENAREDLNEKR